jgi:hypothetical protein
MLMLGRRACIGVEHPLTEAEVRAQGHVEQMWKGVEMTLETTCRFALFGCLESNQIKVSM